MSKHEKKDDFLNTLYRQSAQETPPEHLDERILELAKARQPHKPFARTLQWQRLLSMAAVMLLTVYIFFDVRHDRPAVLEQAQLSAPESMLDSAAPSRQQAPAERSEAHESSAPLQQPAFLKQKQARQAAEPIREDEKAGRFSDSAAESLPETRSLQPETAAKKHSTSDLATQPGQDDFYNGQNALLQQINEHLKAGRTEEAKALFVRFKERFPDYPLPESIRGALAE